MKMIGLRGRGSSPHTRGALRPGAFLGHRLGDHPRIRGEHVTAPDAAVLVPGIIPAYAGNTSPVSFQISGVLGSSPHTRGTRDRARCRCPCTRDHPRIRGEHFACIFSDFWCAGIIPAYAGNTAVMYRSQVMATGSSPHTRGTQRLWRQWRGSRRDHPRIRGEHIDPEDFADFLMGSSPHTRGTLSSSAGNIS